MIRVAVPLAYIRLEDGSVAELEEGTTVPDEATYTHVTELLGKGVLVDDGEHRVELPPAPVEVPAGGDAGEGSEVAPAVVEDGQSGDDADGKGGDTPDPVLPPAKRAAARPAPPRGGSSS